MKQPQNWPPILILTGEGPSSFIFFVNSLHISTHLPAIAAERLYISSRSADISISARSFLTLLINLAALVFPSRK
jgi:hypothetical protein